MKLKTVKTANRPFVELSNLKLQITTLTNASNQIIQFNVRLNGDAKTFLVIDHNIEGAWKELEKFILLNDKARRR